MQADQILTFGPYRFAPQTGQLGRGKHEVSLTRKATAVLRLLVERAGQVVSKEEVFQTVWSDTVVSDAALTSCIQELRHALHDNARKPRYIETVHRRGFRFLGKVASDQFSVVSNEDNKQGARSREHGGKIPLSSPAPNTQHLTPVMVGRETDLAFLHERLVKALHGERQLIFVTGEPGIGKTTVVDVFVQGLASRGQHQDDARQGARSKEQGAKISMSSSALSSGLPAPCFARGQCIEHYGAGEAYLPILEAVGRLCREEGGKALVVLLRQHAPSWLVQMPSLLSLAELKELQQRTANATRERMLRELAEALEVITAERPLILVLEDLHWSDVSTLDLLSMLARRQEPARLLIIGTYRPVEVLTREHPLKGVKQELQLHGQCEELALDFLSEGGVAEYLQARLPGGAPGQSPQHLARLIHQRTDGNPLFMVNVTNELLAQGVVTRDLTVLCSLEELGIGIPENLRQLVEQQLTRASPEECKILEAASVAGAEFSAAAIAAGVEQSIEAVEIHCDSLVRREQFLRGHGTSEWPDGTVAARYGFVHALYQDVLYDQLSASRHIRLHRQIGERQEQAYGERAREIAAQLAVHFEQGRDYYRAVTYRQLCGENARQRNAYQEAASHFTRGLELLSYWPETAERIQQELVLLTALGPVLSTTQGYGASEVERVYLRAQELIPRVEEPSREFLVLNGLWNVYEVQGKHQLAYEFAKQFLDLAQHKHDAVLLVQAHYALAVTLFYLEDLAAARVHIEQGLTLYDQRTHGTLAFLYGQDMRVACLLFAGHILWSLGYPDQALLRNYEAIAWAQELAHPYSLAYALTNTAWRHQLRREAQAARERAEAAIRLCKEHGFLLMLAQGTLWWGWALSEQGEREKGIEQIRHGLTAWQATKAELALPYFFTLLAEAYRKIGQIKEGLALVAKGLAIAHRNNEHWYEAELHRLQGELLFESAGTYSQSSFGNLLSTVEESFQQAINIAHRRKAKSLELRAVMSLVRLRQHQARDHAPRNTQHVNRTRLAEAHKMLSDLYRWFSEGFDTKDLQEAKDLLEELSS